MYAEERQQAIAALVISQGRASVAELAQTYDVTTETVRRDLAALEARPWLITKAAIACWRSSAYMTLRFCGLCGFVMLI